MRAPGARCESRATAASRNRRTGRGGAALHGRGGGLARRQGDFASARREPRPDAGSAHAGGGGAVGRGLVCSAAVRLGPGADAALDSRGAGALRIAARDDHRAEPPARHAAREALALLTERAATLRFAALEAAFR